MLKWIPLALFSFSLFSSSLLASPINHLRKVGEGEMQYLFWTLYSAEFYRSQETGSSSSQALKITYFKSISQQALIEATQDQWQHLGYSVSDIRQWSQPLQAIWPNVEPGDELTFISDDTGYGQFYFEDQAIGTVQDPTFSQAFLDIWLSERTTEPELRQQLLGLNR